MSFSHKQEQCEIIAGRTAPLDMLKKKKKKKEGKCFREKEMIQMRSWDQMQKEWQKRNKS